MEIEQEYLSNLNALIDLAIKEDVGSGDITTDSIIPKSKNVQGYLKTKEDGIISGLKVAELVFRKFNPNLNWTNETGDGTKVSSNIIIVNFEGEYRALLSAERIALNFLQRMSGISTKTSEFVKILSNYKTKLLDTRKTVPGFRLLDKYAVKMGGGINHRFGLYDMVMIKDNHIEVAGGITQAVNEVKNKVKPEIKIEVETKNIEEVKEAISANVNIIMLDNMNYGDMKQCVELIGDKALTEASGNVTIENLEKVAETGVDFISVGELTHSVKAFDIGMYIK